MTFDCAHVSIEMLTKLYRKTKELRFQRKNKENKEKKRQRKKVKKKGVQAGVPLCTAAVQKKERIKGFATKGKKEEKVGIK